MCMNLYSISSEIGIDIKINGEIMHTIYQSCNIVNDVISHEVMTSTYNIFIKKNRRKDT